MKSLLLSALYSALRAYLGSGVYERIASLVMTLTTYPDLSGSEKMAKVLELAQREAWALSEYLIRAVVELVLFRAKSA